MTTWAVLTGEYPPQAGGVSDYTRQICHALVAAGDRVTVFAPPCAGPDDSDSRVSVIRLPDHFGRRGRAVVENHLGADRPDRVLVQYVAQAFGMKGMNLPFARWVRRKLPSVAPVWVTFHEVACPFVRRPLKHNLLAWVTRMMARRIATAADRVFVTIPAWGDLLRRIAPRGKSPEWLPVPSNLPAVVDAEAVAAVRRGYPPGTVIGHFGTFGKLITELLEPILVTILRASSDRIVMLIGRNGQAFRDGFTARHPDLAGRIVATGELPAQAAAEHLAACDVIVQPYPDGVSSRRTSAMSGIALGVPVITNLGALSEPIWTAEENGMTLSPDATAAGMIEALMRALLLTPGERSARGEMGRRWYAERFALERVVAVLREERPS